MKNIKILITALLVAGAFHSCKFAEMPFDRYDSEFVFNNKKKAEGYVLGVYQQLPYANTQNNGYNRVDGAMLASATDESAITRQGSSIVMLTDGSLTARKSNPDGNWGQSYTLIRDANIGIAGLEGLPEADHDYKVLWQAELKFLKAFAYFELLKRYGGVPILDRAYGLDENLNIPRSTFADCVDYIADLCDEAAAGLPEIPDPSIFGRAAKGTALALKARLLLYAASPLYNSTGYDNSGNPYICYGNTDQQRWNAAAEAAAEVINLRQYGIYVSKAIADTDNNATVISKGEENYRRLFLTITGNSELILPRTSPVGNQVEKQNLPVGITNAEGLTSPSQQMVDAYGMVNGKAREADGSGYDRFSPYVNRDPRFYGSIFHNGQTWAGVTIETFTGGAHNNTTGTSTVTGYYMSKFCSSDVVISGTQTNTYHCFPIMRYGEVLLNYAEASNEAWGPDTDECGTGLTPRDALKLLRSRVLRPSETDIDAATGDKAAAREAIRSERRVELAFEDHRYYDLKRWMTAQSVLNENIRGIRITPQSGGGFAYTPVENVSSRQFSPKFYIYPIPNGDVVNNSAILSNNPLW